MEFYPAELATPPLALVALLGCPDMHGIVGEFLRAAQKPPINSLGIAEPAMAARLFGETHHSVYLHGMCCAGQHKCCAHAHTFCESIMLLDAGAKKAFITAPSGPLNILKVQPSFCIDARHFAL